MTRVLACAGTHPAHFSLLHRAVAALVEARHEVTWQHGSSLPVPGARNVGLVSHADLTREMLTADLVLTQASPGLVFQAIRLQRPVICIARRKERREHVDDHQVDFAAWLSAEGYAISVEDLTELSESLSRALEYPRALDMSAELALREKHFATDVWALARSLLEGGSQ